MHLDPYSYVAPSRVSAFVCPIGSLKKSTFLNYIERLVNDSEVRLVDVTPDRRSDRGKYQHWPIVYKLINASHVQPSRVSEW